MMQTFTDIHQHLLWGMDDGADSPDVMYSMLREAHRQGIDAVVATPHAEPGFRPFDMGMYTERLTEAQNFCNSEKLGIRVLPGAEIAWTYQTPLALRQGKVPTIGGTDYVLLELWRNIAWHAARDAVNQLTRAGFCPVLAHPERYTAFVLSPKETVRFRNETGAMLQISSASLLNPRHFAEKRFVRYLLNEHAVDVVATDAHNCSNRPVNLGDAYNWLVSNTDKTYARALTTFDGVLL